MILDKIDNSLRTVKETFSPLSRFFNAEKFKQQELEKKAKKEALELRTTYFETLKKDPRFKQFVINELFMAHITALSDIRNIQGGEDIDNEIKARKMTVLTLEKILFELIK